MGKIRTHKKQRHHPTSPNCNTTDRHYTSKQRCTHKSIVFQGKGEEKNNRSTLPFPTTLANHAPPATTKNHCNHKLRAHCNPPNIPLQKSRDTEALLSRAKMLAPLTIFQPFLLNGQNIFFRKDEFESN
jgi:hypothetical protein